MRQARVHGGALGAAMAAYGGERDAWLDLSTGINPAPPPLPALTQALWSRLPEEGLEAEAIAAARRFYDLPREAEIVCAPGSQALISLLPHLLPPGPAAVLAPSYAEHARALACAGHDAVPVHDLDDVPAGARLAIIVNPNNPDGRRFGRSGILHLAATLAARGGFLVVDEAFMDADPRESVATEAGSDGLVVLRSFGKFFGLAGVRLGFALTGRDLARRIAERLGPWSVSGPALAIGAALMGDAVLVESLRADIARRSRTTRAAIRAAGLEPVGDAALFALVETPDAGPLFEALARRHILTRPFDDRPDWLRIGQVSGEDEARRLTQALREALDRGGGPP